MANPPAQKQQALSRRFWTVTVAAATSVAATTCVATAGVAAAAAPVGTVRGADVPAADLVKDQYIVGLKDQATSRDRVGAAASTLTSRYGGTVTHTYSNALRGYSATMNPMTAARLAANPDVEYVEQVHRVRATATQVSPPSWGLDRIDQSYLPLDGGYTATDTAPNVTVYVIDTGIRTSHTEFGGRATVGFDAINDGRNGQDCNGHGTHVAGTIGGSTYGVAKGVRLVAVRVLDCAGTGTNATVMAGIDWVTTQTARPAVANLSLGGPPSAALDRALRTSIASGVSYVVAAGNDNTPSCSVSPARVRQAVTVGATDRTDNRASFSNWGDCNDLFAPGVDITSAGIADDNAMMSLSGTSMAAPHVSGAAALILSARPTLTPAQVQSTLVANTIKSHRILNTSITNTPSNLPPAGTWRPSTPPTAAAGSRIAMAANGDRTDLFVAGTDAAHTISHAARIGASWTGWEQLGGVATTGTPTAVWSTGTRLDLFATGPNNSVWHRWFDPSGWHPWESLGGGKRADIVAVSPNPGEIDLFINGLDDAIWHRNFDGYNWTVWQSFGGKTLGHNFSAVADPVTGGDHLVVQGTDRNVYHRYFDGQTLTAWNGLGGNIQADVKVVATSDGRIDIFATGANNVVWHRHWTRTAWQPWQSLGGGASGGGVEAAAWDSAHVDLFIRGLDGRVYQRRYNNKAWTPWARVGTTTTTVPTAIGTGTFQVDLAYPATATIVGYVRWS